MAPKEGSSGSSFAAKVLLFVLVGAWCCVAALLMSLEQSHPHDATHNSPENHPHLRHSHAAWGDIMMLDGYAQASLPVIEEFAAEGREEGEEEEEEEEKEGTMVHESDHVNSSPTEDEEYDENGALRIVAIGDVHGDLAALKRALYLGGVLCPSEEELNPMRRGPAPIRLCAAKTKTLVVQVGDLVDAHGQSDRETLDFMAALRDRMRSEQGMHSSESGGGSMMDLLVILGEHDVEHLPKLWPAAGSRSGSSSGSSSSSSSSSRSGGGASGGASGEVRGGGNGKGEGFGAREPREVLPSWMQVAAVHGGTLFVHGSLLEEALDAAGGSLAAMNEAADTWLRSGRNGGFSRAPAWVGDARSSPLWSRTFGKEAAAVAPEDCALLRRVLERVGAERMVVGHTLRPEGVSMVCGGEADGLGSGEHGGGEGLRGVAWRIDVGLGRGQGRAAQVGASQVLEIHVQRRRQEREPTNTNAAATTTTVRVLTQRGEQMPEWKAVTAQ